MGRPDVPRGTPGGDPIDAAIAAAEQPAPTMVGITVALAQSGGRQVAVQVPLDLRPTELLEFIAWLSSGLPGHLAQQRGPQLVVPQAGAIRIRPS